MVAENDHFEPELGNEAADLLDEIKKIATEGGGIDGAHHKQWHLDQIVRAITGDGYAKWRADYCAGEDGPETYGWDEGIAP